MTPERLRQARNFLKPRWNARHLCALSEVPFHGNRFSGPESGCG